MKKINNTCTGFSLVIAMGFTMILGLVSILILEFVIPYNQNVKGLENGSVAYYNAYTGVESSMFALNKNNVGYSSGQVFPTTATGTQFNLAGKTSTIPPAGQGNSEYDSNWNRFDPNVPIQLQLGTGVIDFNQTDFFFRVPDVSGIGAKTLSGTTKIIINWNLSGSGSSNYVSLNASGSLGNSNYITVNDINSLSNINIGSKLGVTLDGDECSINDFYNDTCSGDGIVADPVLKLSIVNSLADTDGGIIPYLEYQIIFEDSGGSPIEIPGRYAQIRSEGKAYGFKKTIDIQIPQTSTNQAFDFTVFQ